MQWNEHHTLAGDTEAIATLHETERIFAQERTRGETAFRVEADKPAERWSSLTRRPCRSSSCQGRWRMNVETLAFIVIGMIVTVAFILCSEFQVVDSFRKWLGAKLTGQ